MPGGNPPGTSFYVMLPGRPLTPHGNGTGPVPTAQVDPDMRSAGSRADRRVIKNNG